MALYHGRELLEVQCHICNTSSVMEKKFLHFGFTCPSCARDQKDLVDHINQKLLELNKLLEMHDV